MLTLQETKVFLRVDGDEDDTLISSLIITAQVLTEDSICLAVQLEILPLRVSFQITPAQWLPPRVAR